MKCVRVCERFMSIILQKSESKGGQPLRAELVHFQNISDMGASDRLIIEWDANPDAHSLTFKYGSC